MTDGGGGYGGGGNGGGKNPRPYSPLPSSPFSFLPSPLFYPEYEKLWMEPKGLEGDINGHHSYCSITLRSYFFFVKTSEIYISMIQIPNNTYE